MINGVLDCPNPYQMGDYFSWKDGALVFNSPTTGIFTPLDGVSCTQSKPLWDLGLACLQHCFECRFYEYSIFRFLL